MDPDGADASEPDAPCLKRHGEDRAIHAAAAPCPSGSRLLAPERLAVGAKEGRKRRDDQTTAPRPPRGRVVPSSAGTCQGEGQRSASATRAALARDRVEKAASKNEKAIE